MSDAKLDVEFIRSAEVDYPGIVAKAARTFLPEAASVVLETAKDHAPVDTGNLKGSLHAQVGESEASVVTNVEYAPHVEWGTGPHMINAPVKIRDVGWRYITEHPGTKEQPFMRPAIDLNRTKLVQMLARHVREAIPNG